MSLLFPCFRSSFCSFPCLAFPSLSLSSPLSPCLPDPPILLCLHLSCRGDNSVLLAVCLCVAFSRCAHPFPICHQYSLLLVTRLFMPVRPHRIQGASRSHWDRLHCTQLEREPGGGRPCAAVLSCDGLLSVLFSHSSHIAIDAL